MKIIASNFHEVLGILLLIITENSIIIYFNAITSN